MKKENVLKKVLVKSLVGFTAGVTLLMIAYASVYFIAGESVFKNEISQLQNIKTLITQFVVIGIAYYLLFISFHIFSILQNKDFKDQYMAEHPYRTVLFISLSILILLWVVEYMISRTKIYGENIRILNLIILVLNFALEGLVFCIKSTRESHLIKKINKKLQERDS